MDKINTFIILITLILILTLTNLIHFKFTEFIYPILSGYILLVLAVIFVYKYKKYKCVEGKCSFTLSQGNFVSEKECNQKCSK